MTIHRSLNADHLWVRVVILYRLSWPRLFLLFALQNWVAVKLARTEQRMMHDENKEVMRSFETCLILTIKQCQLSYLQAWLYALYTRTCITCVIGATHDMMIFLLHSYMLTLVDFVRVSSQPGKKITKREWKPPIDCYTKWAHELCLGYSSLNSSI